MNKIRYIGIAISIAFILAIGILEITTSTKYLNDTLKDATQLSQISNEDNFFSAEIESKVDELKESWRQKEKVLCFLVNHKDIEEIGEKLNIIKSSIIDKDYVNYKENLDLVIFYCNSYKHVFSLSAQNIF